MGHGAYSGEVFRSQTLSKIQSGTNHDYSRNIMRTPRSEWKVNELLDPKRKNQKGDNAGKITRESLDFPEHPNTTPIVVLFDVTGSMAQVPGIIQKELPKLMQTLIAAGVPDPQILIGAVGDAYSDTMPIQIGQFESDNRIDEQIDAIVLESGGGGGNHESYELAAYMLAYHSQLDSALLRNEKGFVFFIGDERIYSQVNPEQVEKHLGEKIAGGEALETKVVFDKLKEQFEPFFIMSEHGGYRREQVVPHEVGQEGNGLDRYSVGCLGWADLIDPEQIVVMPDATQLCDKITQIVTVRKGEKVEA